jgi:hypothetical protein
MVTPEKDLLPATYTTNLEKSKTVRTCEHTTTDIDRNKCDVPGVGIHTRRGCFICSKNTTRGADGVPTWPAKETLPVVKVVTVNGKAVDGTAVPVIPCPTCGKPAPAPKNALEAMQQQQAELGEI